MKRLLQLGVVLLAWATVSACAFSPVKRPTDLGPVTDTYTYGASPEEALRAARSALEGAGYEVEVENKDLRLVRSRPRGVPTPAICDCGTWNGAKVAGTAFSQFSLTVNPEEAGSSIAIEHRCGTNFTGQNLYGATTRAESYECASKGAPERQVMTYLEKLLGPGKAVLKPACTQQEMAQMRMDGWSTERIRGECSRRTPKTEVGQ